jgi:hypothetical protein
MSEAPMALALCTVGFRSMQAAITLSGVSIAVVIIVVVLLATVSTQINKVLKANPVDGLKVE